MPMPIGAGATPINPYGPATGIRRTNSGPGFVASKSTLPPGISGMNAKEVNNLIRHAKHGMSGSMAVDNSGMSGLAPADTICGKIQRALQAKMSTKQKIAVYALKGAIGLAQLAAD